MTTIISLRTMLLATVWTLSSQPTRGIQYEDFPSTCNNSTLILDSAVGSTLRKDFLEIPELKCLAIPYSGVKTINNGAFDGVPNLIYLNLTGNMIPPDQLFSFGKLGHLESLVINDQQSSSKINKVLIKTVYPSLKSLELRNTKLSTMTVAVQFPFPVLEHLDLSRNHYTVYRPMEKMFHDTIVHLNLSHNLITLVNARGFSKLTTLALDDNKIQSVGYRNDLSLLGLNSLENLSVANNEIASINKTAFNDTKNLKELNLSGNLLTMLDVETFSSLSSLEILHLDRNQLRMIPFGLPHKLTSLSLDCNNISFLIMESLYKLPELRRLSLGGNRITNIDRTAFFSQGLLEELHLNDNRLNNLPAYWGGYLKSLRYLNLAGNRFTSIQFAFSLTNSPLQEIRLDEDPIASIDANALKLIPENTTIYLNVGAERSKDICPL